MTWSLDTHVPPGGYAWWYIDAISDDGRQGLCVIFFVGSVFSSRYHAARRSGPAMAERFSAVNLALYGRHRAWVMTEYDHVERTDVSLRLGSNMWRHGRGTRVTIHERTAPLHRWPCHSVRGEIELLPTVTSHHAHSLDPVGVHQWWPAMPRARVRVELTEPALTFEGHAYHDTNRGMGPLEDTFVGWSWARSVESPVSQVYYAPILREGVGADLALELGTHGTSAAPAAADTHLPRTKYGLRPMVRGPAGLELRAVWEDTPFYCRGLAHAHGSAYVYEYLSLTRFAAPWVQRLIPFRTRRAA